MDQTLIASIEDQIVIAPSVAITLLTLLFGATWWTASIATKLTRIERATSDLSVRLTREFGGHDSDQHYIPGRLSTMVSDTLQQGDQNQRAIKRIGAKIGFDPFDSDPLSQGAKWEPSS